MNSDVSFSVVAASVVQGDHKYITGDVLDVGCGAKPYKRLFYDPIDHVYLEGITSWTGLDVRPVGDIQGDVSKHIEADDASYDTVVCVDTLSYVFDLHGAMNEMTRVLKQGGIFFLIEPNCREEDSNAFWGFRMKGLGALAESHGLEVVELKSASRLWAGEFENFRGQTKHGFALPGELQGWIDAMDEKYPNISVLVARKA